MLSLRKLSIIVLGSLLIAIGTDFYLVPFKVLDGGIIGIALIMNYMFGFKIGLVIILCSIPIFRISWVRNRTFFYKITYEQLPKRHVSFICVHPLTHDHL